MLVKSFIISYVVTFLTIPISHAQSGTEGITHYIFPDFVEGVVLMKNGRKNEVSINYNSISEEMVFKKGSLKLAIGNTESQLIDTIFMSSRKFIRVDSKFMEVLYLSDDIDLFVQYKCRVHEPGQSVGLGGTSETAAVDTYSSIQKDGRFYELTLPEGYTSKPYVVYYIKRDGTLYEISSMNRLEKRFKKQKDEFKRFVKSNKARFDDPSTIQELIRHLDSIN